MPKPQCVIIDNSKIPKVAASERPVFPPRKRSIPNGFDFDFDEVWWNRLKNRPAGSSNDMKDPLNRIVPSQYYSRHLQPTTSTSGDGINEPGPSGIKTTKPKLPNQPEAWTDTNTWSVDQQSISSRYGGRLSRESQPIRSDRLSNVRDTISKTSLGSDNFDF